jgi:hypothetical protein
MGRSGSSGTGRIANDVRFKVVPNQSHLSRLDMRLGAIGMSQITQPRLKTHSKCCQLTQVATRFFVTPQGSLCHSFSRETPAG